MLVERKKLLKPANYYEVPLVGNSGLGEVLRRMNGERVQIKASADTLLFGSLTHLAVYQPKEFELHEAIVQNKDNPFDVLRNSVLELASIARTDNVLNAIINHKDCIFEADVYATVGGIPVKVKPDAHIPGIIVQDLKTTSCTSKEQFVQSCINYGYFRQAFLYGLVLGIKDFIFTGVCKKIKGRVFTVSVANYPEQMKTAGEQVENLLHVYTELNPDYIENASKFLVDY